MKAKLVYVAAALAMVFSLVVIIAPAKPAMADTITVANLNDSGAGSLRQAIADANPNDTIDFTVTGTITLTSGQLAINKSVTINGPGEANLAISGNDNSRVFYINNSTVDMSGMTIRNGNTSEHGGGLYNDGGNVTMTGCTVSDNEALAGGGGMHNSGGNVTMTGCTISGNKGGVGGGEDGGGILNYIGILTMTNCTVSGNDADNSGGGIHSYDGNVTMTNCTVSGNEVKDSKGGGISNNYGDLTLTSCTISGNTAAEEGGEGGGVYNDAEVGNVTMTCTIVYDNTAPTDPNFSGSYTDTSGESIVDEPLGSAPNPLLGPLQNNGGPTETHALLTGSPAIDACVTGCTVDTDQRGVSRPQLTACDVGAYEYQQQSTLPVGGTVEPVDRIGILTPWLVLAAFISMALAVAVVIKRRRSA
jgi:parallel beta-helix repeat protein